MYILKKADWNKEALSKELMRRAAKAAIKRAKGHRAVRNESLAFGKKHPRIITRVKNSHLTMSSPNPKGRKLDAITTREHFMMRKRTGQAKKFNTYRRDADARDFIKKHGAYDAYKVAAAPYRFPEMQQELLTNPSMSKDQFHKNYIRAAVENKARPQISQTQTALAGAGLGFVLGGGSNALAEGIAGKGLSGARKLIPLGVGALTGAAALSSFRKMNQNNLDAELRDPGLLRANSDKTYHILQALKAKHG
jgi:hypothetical protein